MASVADKSAIMTRAARELVDSYPVGQRGPVLRFQKSVALLNENEAARLYDLIQGPAR